jgi:hypothetical protein
MPITPDTKDWTWVLERPCDECGYNAAGVRAGEVAGAVRANAAAWPAVLARPNARVRPDADSWSALEYGAHVRDVLRLYRVRLALMMEQDDPLYPNWDQDATAVADDYNGQDPVSVAGEILDAAAALAADFDAVTGAGWRRPGRRSDGAAFTVDTFALYFLHDVVHHLADVRG